MAVKNYRGGSGCSLIFGAIDISGLTNGVFISVERDTDAFTKVVGADGEGMRSKSNDKSATITITLMQSSSSNDALSAIAAS